METSGIAQTRLTVLKEAEISKISGGSRISGNLFTMALFMVSPAIGIFHFGVREGYREEARQYQ